MLGMFREGFLGDGTWLGPSGVAMWTLGRPGGQQKCLSPVKVNGQRFFDLSKFPPQKACGHPPMASSFVQPFRYLPKFAKAPSLA